MNVISTSLKKKQSFKLQMTGEVMTKIIYIHWSEIVGTPWER